VILMAIDPGNIESAWALYDTHRHRLEDFGKQANAQIRDRLRLWRGEVDHVAIEMIASYGMPVGAEVFDTCVNIGRLIEAWGNERETTLVYRREVKLHLCGQARAKDINIRAALIDRFGPGREKAIGTKSSPGPLYRVSADVWSALAVAVTYSDAQSQTCGKSQATHSQVVS
jgi:hypothetical protein